MEIYIKYLIFEYPNYYNLFYNPKVIEFLIEHKKFNSKNKRFVLNKLKSYDTFTVRFKIDLYSIHNVQIDFKTLRGQIFFSFDIKLFELNQILHTNLKDTNLHNFL